MTYKHTCQIIALEHSGARHPVARAMFATAEKEPDKAKFISMIEAVPTAYGCETDPRTQTIQWGERFIPLEAFAGIDVEILETKRLRR